MQRPLLTLLTLFFLLSNPAAQEKTYTIPNSPLLDFIRNSRFNGVQIRSHQSKSNQLFKLLGTRFDHYPQFFLVADQQILIYVGATGIVYKSVEENRNDSVTFVRLDKTEHFGYNINAFPFVYKKQLFNIGGYGFWHWNGQLRGFSEKSMEWYIVPLNKELPVAMDHPGSYLWVSEKENKLFSFSYIKGNDAIKTNKQKNIETVDSVLELDLQSNEWKTKGALNPIFKNTINLESTFANLDSGILFCNNSPILLYLNILNNKIDTIDNIDLYHFYATTKKDIIYWYNSGYFYRGNISNSTLDSIRLDYADFKRGDTPIYIVSNKSNVSHKYLYFLFVIPIFMWGLRSKVISKKKTEIVPLENEIKLKSPYKKNDLFDEVEKALIKFIDENAKNKNTRTSTDEVNRILGVGNKSVDMQKRKRSDIIKSINMKYQLIDPNKILIERVKSELDARLQEYYLTTDTLDFLNDMNNQTQE
jgi:hypothetical protein